MNNYSSVSQEIDFIFWHSESIQIFDRMVEIFEIWNFDVDMDVQNYFSFIKSLNKFGYKIPYISSDLFTVLLNRLKSLGQ